MQNPEARVSVIVMKNPEEGILGIGMQNPEGSVSETARCRTFRKEFQG